MKGRFDDVVSGESEPNIKSEQDRVTCDEVDNPASSRLPCSVPIPPFLLVQSCRVYVRCVILSYLRFSRSCSRREQDKRACPKSNLARSERLDLNTGRRDDGPYFHSGEQWRIVFELRFHSHGAFGTRSRNSCSIFPIHSVRPSSHSRSDHPCASGAAVPFTTRRNRM